MAAEIKRGAGRLYENRRTNLMKSNSKPRFNSIDLIIILVVAAVIAAGIYMLAPKKGGSTEGAAAGNRNVKATIQIELMKKEAYLTELPKVGDSVTIGVKEKMPAVVTKVESKPAEEISYDLNVGTASWQEIPNMYDIYITMEADAVETQKDIEINGSAIRIGDSDAVRSKGWAGHGFITQLEISE